MAPVSAPAYAKCATSSPSRLLHPINGSRTSDFLIGQFQDVRFPYRTIRSGGLRSAVSGRANSDSPCRYGGLRSAVKKLPGTQKTSHFPRNLSQLSLTIFVNINTFVVKLSFKTRKLEKQLTDPAMMQKKFGQMAKKVNQRMKELRAAENLEDLMSIPAARCHLLHGDKKDCYAVDISGNHRLIFEPDHHPLPRKDDNSVNHLKITDIRILNTEDYH